MGVNDRESPIAKAGSLGPQFSIPIGHNALQAGGHPRGGVPSRMPPLWYLAFLITP